MSRIPSRLAVRSPLLGGGISQQPAPLRFPGQVQDATNADFTVRDGISKRLGSVFVTRFTGLDASGNYRLHPIDRDGTERYQCVYGRASSAMAVRVYAADGTQATVTISTAAQTYLNLNNATADQLRFRTFGDTTFIVNTTVTTALVESPAFSITGTFNNYERMLSTMPTSGTYHRTSSTDENYPAGFWNFALSFGTFAYTQNNADLTLSSILTQVNAVGNQPCGMGFQSVRDMTQTNCTWTDATRTLTKTGAFAGYTHRGGDVIRVTSGTGVAAPADFTIERKIDDNSIVIATDINGGSGDVSNIATSYIRRITYVTADLTGSSSIEHAMAKLTTAFRNAGSDVVIERLVGLQRVRCYGEFRGTVSGTGSGGSAGAGVVAATGAVLDVGALLVPTAANTAGTGTVNASNPDRQEVTSRWTRVAAPSQPGARLDATKMPVVMQRTVVGPPATFTINQAVWDDRLSGDNDTNPAPALIRTGKAIADVAFIADRLVLLGGEYLAFSQDGDAYNFFAEDELNLIESDPISRQLGTDQVALGERMIPLNNKLLIFTKAGRQFEVSADGAYTPSTVIVDAGSAYNSQPIDAVTMHQYVYFVSTQGRFSSVREYGYQTDSLAVTAQSISEHVPNLIASNVRRIASVPVQNMLAVLPAAGNTLLVWRGYWNGPRKEQSAWSKWTLDATNRICDVSALDENLWVLIESQSQYTLEYFPLAEPTLPTNFTSMPRIDRLLTPTSASFSGGNTTWNLPSSLTDTTLNRIVTSAGVEYTATMPTSSTIRVAGVDLSAATVVGGRSYAMTVELSRPYLRDQSGSAEYEIDLILSAITAHHQNTQAYTLRCDHNYAPRSNQSRTFTATSPSSGLFRMGVGNAGSRARLFIESSSAAPCSITGIEYDIKPFLELR